MGRNDDEYDDYPPPRRSRRSRDDDEEEEGGGEGKKGGNNTMLFVIIAIGAFYFYNKSQEEKAAAEKKKKEEEESKKFFAASSPPPASTTQTTQTTQTPPTNAGGSTAITPSGSGGTQGQSLPNTTPGSGFGAAAKTLVGDTKTQTQAQIAAKTYKFFQGMDSASNDISQDASLAGKIDKLKQKCDTLPNCKGFNTKGYFKSAIRPETQWDRFSEDIAQGMYVQEKVYNELPQGKQYVKIPDWDTYSSDIKQVTNKPLADIQAECDTIDNCVAFNQAGYLKSAITSPMDWTNNQGGALYVRKEKVPELKSQLRMPFMVQTAQNNLCVGQNALSNQLTQVPLDRCAGWEQTTDNKIRTRDGKLYWIADYNGNEDGRVLRLSDQYKDQPFTHSSLVFKHVNSGRCVHPQGGKAADGYGLVTHNLCWDEGDPGRLQFVKKEYDWDLKNDERWKNLS